MLAKLPDGRKLDFRCAGDGRPTVLLEGGFAADSLAWSRVEPLLVNGLRVCAYDRAGAGFSTEGPPPRDAAAIARDLDDGLRALGIEGPYVLAGHSAGALYMRVFAGRRPQDVVGMVLVEPSVEHQDQRFAAVFGPGAGSLAGLRDKTQRCLDAAQNGQLPSKDNGLSVCTPRPGASTPRDRQRLAAALRPATWRTQIEELDSLWSASSDEAAAVQLEGQLARQVGRVIVLTADNSYAAVPAAVRPAVDSLWRGLHQRLAARWPGGRWRLVTGSSHLMMNDRPDAVAAAIREVARP